MAEKLGTIEYDNLSWWRVTKNQCSQSVVWQHEILLAGKTCESAPCRPDSWIDDCDMNSSGWAGTPGCRELKASFENILWWNGVCQVNKANLWGKTEDHGFHLSHIGIALAEIRQ
jgi:hypothetical protein